MRHALLEEMIIAALAKGPRGKIELRNDVVGRNLSYQAFYKAFKKLRTEEIVVVHKNAASLSVVWIQNEMRRVERVAAAYRLPAYRSYFGSLKDGQRLSFRFKTLAELDLFWTHVVLVAIPSAHKSAVIVSLIPHDWFDTLRPMTAAAWYAFLGVRNAHVNVVTHASPEERWLSEHPGMTIENMFGVNPLRQDEATYLNVIDDLVIEAKLDSGVVPGIRRAMRGESVDIRALTTRPGVFKLRVQRSKRRAEAMRKKVRKYFSIRF